VQTMRGAARSHHSRTSLRDLASIPSTATQSIPRLTQKLLSHYITYAMAVSESVTSFAPSWHYGGKSGGRGFRGPFLSFSSSFARGGGGANEGRACFPYGVGRMKCDDTRRRKVFYELYDTRPSHIHPLQVSKRENMRREPSRRRNLRRPRTCLAASCDSGVRRWRIRVTGVFLICLRASLARQTKSSSLS
jgi:hypothetical protein